MLYGRINRFLTLDRLYRWLIESVTQVIRTCQCGRRRGKMSDENKRREKRVRVNEQDLDAVKTARESEFSPSTAMGYVIQMACRQMVSDGGADDSEVKL